MPATTRGTAPEIPDISGEQARTGTTTGEDDNAGAETPVDWAALDGEGEGDEQQEQQTGDTTEGDRGELQQQKPAQQQQQQQQQQQRPAQQQQPATLTEEEVQRRVQEELAKQGQQPAAASETPEQKAAREAAERQASEKAQADMLKQLTEYYKLPDDAAAKLQSEPELVLPDLAARVHQAVLQGARQMFLSEAPQLFAQLQARSQANEKAKSAFYGKWPQLAAHEKHVLQVARMYRQMNPKATPEQVIDRVGRVVTAALNLSQEPAKSQQSGQQKPAAQRSSFRPAATAASASAAPPPNDNVFTQLAEEFLQEDQG